MTIEELRERLAKEEAALADKSGKAVLFSKGGPVSIGIIRAIVDTVETQARQIEELKARLDGGAK